MGAWHKRASPAPPTQVAALQLIEAPLLVVLGRCRRQLATFASAACADDVHAAEVGTCYILQVRVFKAAVLAPCLAAFERREPPLALRCPMAECVPSTGDLGLPTGSPACGSICVSIPAAAGQVRPQPACRFLQQARVSPWLLCAVRLCSYVTEVKASIRPLARRGAVAQRSVPSQSMFTHYPAPPRPALHRHSPPTTLRAQVAVVRGRHRRDAVRGHGTAHPLAGHPPRGSGRHPRRAAVYAGACRAASQVRGCTYSLCRDALATWVS